MKIFDLLSMCIHNLVRRKFRTLLTVIGVVIGTTSIVMMISLGIGISTQQEEQLKMWGDLTIIQVWFGGGGTQTQTALDDDAIAKIAEIEGVDVATPFMRLELNSEPVITTGKSNQYRWRYPEIVGLNPEAIEKLGYKIKEGESLPTGKTKEIKVVFGGSAAYNFEDSRKKFNNMRSEWPDEKGEIQQPFFNPLMEKFKFTIPPVTQENGNTGSKLEYEFEVVGTLVGERNKSESMWNIFVPLEVAKQIQADYNKENGIKTPKSQKKSYNEVKVKVLDMDQIPDIEKQIKDMGFGTWSMESQRKETQKSMQQMQLILGGLGAISLLVSAISITNTMIMSVYERTREIGIMKVLGCLVGYIRTLFLMEAGFIGFFGGIFGIGISYLLSTLLNVFGSAAMAGGGGGRRSLVGMLGLGRGVEGAAAKISIIPLWLVLLGLVFATGIGLISGFYPANRAVKISALEAIKQE